MFTAACHNDHNTYAAEYVVNAEINCTHMSAIYVPNERGGPFALTVTSEAIAGPQRTCVACSRFFGSSYTCLFLHVSKNENKKVRQDVFHSCRLKSEKTEAEGGPTGSAKSAIHRMFST